MDRDGVRVSVCGGRPGNCATASFSFLFGHGVERLGAAGFPCGRPIARGLCAVHAQPARPARQHSRADCRAGAGPGGLDGRGFFGRAVGVNPVAWRRTYFGRGRAGAVGVGPGGAGGSAGTGSVARGFGSRL